MDYQEARNYIESIGSSGIIPGLDRIRALLDRVDHPERHCHFIHVAGTNGKGSVCAYIANVLQEAGYRVGRYISPVLFDYRERIQINGQWITENHLAEYMQRVADANAFIMQEGMDSASAFEIETVLAWLYFKDQECDFVVAETGMGGLEDATNVLENPLVSVITSISMDHMFYLGDTIEAIAAQKAGIIKPHCPVVMDGTNKQAVTIIQNVCKSMNSSWDCVYPYEIIQKNASIESGQSFSFRGRNNLHTDLLGVYQQQNACLAVAVMDMLRNLVQEDDPKLTQLKLHNTLTDEVIVRGIEKTKWPGRFEMIATHPVIIVDGAHNPDGASVLKTSLLRYFSGQDIIGVMGVFKDKDYHGILREMQEVCRTLYVYQAEGSRGLSVEQLYGVASNYIDHVEKASLKDALLAAIRQNPSVIVCFGTLSSIASIEEIIRNSKEVL